MKKRVSFALLLGSLCLGITALSQGQTSDSRAPKIDQLIATVKALPPYASPELQAYREQGLELLRQTGLTGKTAFTARQAAQMQAIYERALNSFEEKNQQRFRKVAFHPAVQDDCDTCFNNALVVATIAYGLCSRDGGSDCDSVFNFSVRMYGVTHCSPCAWIGEIDE